jgi:hypothetical protein
VNGRLRRSHDDDSSSTHRPSIQTALYIQTLGCMQFPIFVYLHRRIRIRTACHDTGNAVSMNGVQTRVAAAVAPPESSPVSRPFRVPLIALEGVRQPSVRLLVRAPRGGRRRCDGGPRGAVSTGNQSTAGLSMYTGLPGQSAGCVSFNCARCIPQVKSTLFERGAVVLFIGTVFFISHRFFPPVHFLAIGSSLTRVKAAITTPVYRLPATADILWSCLQFSKVPLSIWGQRVDVSSISRRRIYIVCKARMRFTAEVRCRRV